MNQRLTTCVGKAHRVLKVYIRTTEVSKSMAFYPCGANAADPSFLPSKTKKKRWGPTLGHLNHAADAGTFLFSFSSLVEKETE